MFGGFGNWLGSVANSLFGGGNNQNQSKPAPSAGFTSSVPKQSQFQNSGKDWVAQQQEEERKRREEEARRQAAAKAAADAAAKEKAAQAQKPQKTVAQNINDFGLNALGFMNDAGQGLGEGGIKTFLNTAEFIQDPIRNITNPDAVNQEVNDLYTSKFNSRRYYDENGPAKTIGQAYGTGVVMALPGWKGGKVIDTLTRGNTAFNTLSKSQKAATIGTDIVGNLGLNIGLTHVMQPQNMDINTEEGRNNLMWNVLPDLGISLGGTAFNAARSARGAQRAVANDVGAMSETAGAAGQTASTAKNALFNELDQIKQDAGNIPDAGTIDTVAGNAGKIDDGISSPSRVNLVKQDLSAKADAAKSALKQRYAATLQGINDLADSMTPKPLAPAVAGADNVPFQPRDIVTPEKPPVLEAKAPEPASVAPTPEPTPIETPITAKSKEVAAATPPAPVKSRTPAEMSDAEIIDRFGSSNPGKSPDEIRAQFAKNAEQLKSESTAKAERDAKKAQRRMAKANELNAVAAQAAKDAGVPVPAKPKKDIFAKTVSNETSTKAADLKDNAGIDPVTTEPVPKTAPVKPKGTKKDIFAKTVDTPAEPAKPAAAQAAAPVQPAPAKPKGNKKDIFAKPKDEGIMQGSVKTGETKKSQGAAGKAGRLKYEAISKAKTAEEGAKAAKDMSISEFLSATKDKTDYTVGDRAAADALLERATPGSKEAKRLNEISQSLTTKGAQITATANSRTNRKVATKNQIQAGYHKRLDDAGIPLTKAANKRVDVAETKFTTARDNAKRLEDIARGAPTKENVAAYEKVQQSVDKLDRQARLVEYKEAYDAAHKALKKGESLGMDQVALLKKLKRDAGVFQYDAVDSSLLSATGTMFNNALNGLFGLSDLAFGSVGAKLGKMKTGEITGGAHWRGLGAGLKEGFKSVNTEIKLRNTMNSIGAGKPGKLWGAYKNAVTTGNEFGEAFIRARINAQVYSHYNQINKAKGFTGEELKNRTKLDMLSDPMDVRNPYADEAYTAQGMANVGRTIAEEKKVENAIKDKIKNSIFKKVAELAGAKEGGKAMDTAEYVSKLTTRVLIGFPSVIFRSGVKGGLKRTPVIGTGYDLLRLRNAKTPADKSRIINEMVQHTGSGLTYSAIGVGLGTAGLVSGAYPTDPNEQKRWQKEGKTEWSIRIGGDWYDLRKSLGAFALPLMINAQIGQNIRNGDAPLEGFVSGDKTKNPLLAVFGVTPVDGILNNLTSIKEIMDGQKGPADMAAQLTKVGIPASGFVNELAKISTAMMGGNELETKDPNKDQMKQFLNDLAVSVPGGGEALGLNPKVVGDVTVKSVSPIGRVFGAQKGFNQTGADENKKDQATANDQNAQFNDVIDSANEDTSQKLRDMLDENNQGLYDQLRQGRQLPPEKVSSVQKAIKSIADGSKGYDSKFAQEGDWASQEAVLKVAKQLKEADPQAKPTEKRDLEQEVTRVGIAKQMGTDPQVYALYRSISNSEFNNMLDKESPEYDPATASKLLELDNAMTKAGVSRNSSGQNGWTRNKYTVKDGSGRGGKGSDRIATDVSIIKADNPSESDLGAKYRKTVGGVPDVASQTPQTNYKKTISIKRGVQL